MSIKKRSATTNHNKSSERLLTLRLSEEQFEELKRRAERLGMSRSAYCRDLLLNSNYETKWPKHQFASALCKHHVLVDQYLTDADVRQQFYDWEVAVWQLLK